MRSHGTRAFRVAVLVQCMLAGPVAAEFSGLAFVEEQPDAFASQPVLSPDGEFLYTGGYGGLGLSSTAPPHIRVYRRDTANGRLTLVEEHTCSGAACSETIGNARGLAMSPDGAHVYVVNGFDGSINLYDRNPTTGGIAFVEALDGTPGLFTPRGLFVSGDGANLYAADGSSIHVFSRDGVTGGLTFLESQVDGQNGVDGLAGVRQLSLSPDDRHVYAVGFDDSTLAVFARDLGTGALTFLEVHEDELNGVDGIRRAEAVEVSPDGAHVYACGDEGFPDEVAVFARDGIAGTLTPIQVFSVGGAVRCRDFAFSPDDDTTLYGAHPIVYRRDPGTGFLSREEPATSTVPSHPIGIWQPMIVPSPDGRHLYVGTNNLDTQPMRLFQRVRVACAPSPQPSCRTPVVSGAARFKMPSSDRFVWKLAKGAATSLGDFGTPEDDTDYAFCVYDAAAPTQPLLHAFVPAGGICGKRDCWRPIAPGHRYADGLRTPDGVKKAKLVTGADGRSKVIVVGAGELLTTLTLPLAPPVTVQMANRAGECWEATFSAPLVNDGTRFVARSD